MGLLERSCGRGGGREIVEDESGGGLGSCEVDRRVLRCARAACENKGPYLHRYSRLDTKLYSPPTEAYR